MGADPPALLNPSTFCALQAIAGQKTKAPHGTGGLMPARRNPEASLQVLGFMLRGEGTLELTPLALPRLGSRLW